RSIGVCGEESSMAKVRDRVGWVALVGGVASLASVAQAISPSLKCEALKLKLAGKYTSCRLAAVAKALKTAGSPDYTTCTTAFTAKWAIADGRGSCPTTADASRIHNQITVDTTNLTARLAGPRYIDNGDGTVTDTETNLMWEKKDPGSDHIEN